MGTGQDEATPPWLGALVEQGIEAMVVFDDQWRIRYANGEAYQLLGYAGSALVGLDALSIVHEDDLGRAGANVSGIGRGARPDPGLIRLLRGDGSWRDYELRPRRIELPEPPTGPGSLMAVSIRDNTMEDSHWLFLAQLASGADFHESLETFTAGLSSMVDGPMAITYEVDGARRSAGELAEPLRWPEPFPPGSPWERALLTGRPAWSLVDDLEGQLRAAADRQGLAAVVVVPVVDPAHRSPALVVQGPHDTAMAEILMIALDRRPREALAIAFERRHAMDRLHELALTDPLTGLANRTSFFETLEALDSSGARYTVCYVDLDGFKGVNDSHGHLVGDEILGVFANRLRAVARPGDVVARLGGDEFAVVYVGVDEERAGHVAARMVEALNQAADVGGFIFEMGASVGVACGGPGRTADVVVAAADAALYSAKHAGRGTWRAATEEQVSLPFGSAGTVGAGSGWGRPGPVGS